LKINVSLIVLLLYAISQFSGCAAGTATENLPQGGGRESPHEWFDPLALNDDDIIINGIEMPSFSNEYDSLNNEGEIDYEAMTEGYRVQIYTTQNMFEADSVLTLSDSLFEGEAYMQFDPPNYKIRVGNLISRSEAEIFQRETRRAGFPSSWVLRTRVFVNPRKSVISPSDIEQD